MKELIIPLEIVNEILGYLGTKPYQEVNLLIDKIQELGKQQAPKPE